MIKGELTVALTGSTGWLGKSLIALRNYPNLNLKLSIFGRKEGFISVDSGDRIQSRTIDVKTISDESFDIFAPFAFLTQEKARNMTESDYINVNKRLIEDSASIIERGKIGSVINLSSGVVTGLSQHQKLNRSYSIYADLKKFQEFRLQEVCSKVGTQFINCRIFSITGIDMPDPFKYAFGDLVSQAKNSGKITLNSPDPVIRRYMDSRELMHILLLSIGNRDLFLESGGFKIDLTDLSQSIARRYNLTSNAIEYRNPLSGVSNEYLSKKDDFEHLAALKDVTLSDISQQISNVEKAIDQSSS